MRASGSSDAGKATTSRPPGANAALDAGRASGAHATPGDGGPLRAGAFTHADGGGHRDDAWAASARDGGGATSTRPPSADGGAPFATESARDAGAWALVDAGSADGATALASAADAGPTVVGSTWDPTNATTFSEATRAALAAVIREARVGGPDDGLSVAVMRGDAAWLSAFGKASIAPRRDATPSTSYRVGSLTKTFTAVATLRLAQQGRLSLDDDVRTYVPRFPEKPWPVTLRQLLGHTGGVGWYRGPRDAWTTAPTTTAQALDLFKDRPLVFEPGADFLYSSFGYVLLGAAIEKSSGRPYADELEASLWRPLGLSRTGLEASAKTKAQRATGYRLVKGKLVPARRLDLSSRFSSGGLRSTAEDLARWAHALMAGEVVDAATWQAMTTPGVTTAGEVTDYGLGFAAYPVRGRKVVAHAGGVPGAAALLLLVPEERLAVVLLSNLQNQAGGMMELATHLTEVLLDDGLPRRGWYSAERADEVGVDGMARVWSHGLVRLRDPAPPPGASPDEAFQALEALLVPARIAEDPQAARLALKEAYHPRNGRVSAVAGAEMARLLESRGQRLRDYGGPRGAAAFFFDYARACAATACPHPLSPQLARWAERLAGEWQRTPRLLLTLRREDFDAAPGLADALAALEGQTSHVDLVEELTRLAWRQRARGQLDASRETLLRSARLHPLSPLAGLALAEGAALDGDAATAVERLREAAALTRPGLARDVVKARAEALQVGATPEGVAALDMLVSQSRAVLPAAGAAAARHLARDASPTRAAPDVGDDEPETAGAPGLDGGAPLQRPRDGGHVASGTASSHRAAPAPDGGVPRRHPDGGARP